MNIITKYAAFIPIGIYLTVFILFSNNIPVGDDYRAILDFFTQYAEGGDVSLFDQFFGHYILPYRLVHWLALAISGSLQFKFVVVFWNAFFSALVFVFFAKVNRERPAVHILPSIIILFTLQYYTTSIWAVLFVSNIALSLSAILLSFHTNVRYQYLGVLVAIATVFNGGNGLAVPFSILIVKILGKHTKSDMLLWGAVLIFSLSAFFWNFDIHLLQGYESGVSAQLEWSRIGTVIYFFGTFLSSGFFTTRGDIVHGIAMFLTVASIIYCYYLTKKQYFKNQPYILTLLLFLISTTIIVAIGRSNIGYQIASVPRYKVYSLLYWTVIIYTVFDFFTLKPKVKSALVILSVGFSVFSFTQYLPVLVKWNEKVDFASWGYHQHLSYNHISHPSASGKTLLDKSNESGIYTLPQSTRLFEIPESTMVSLPMYESKQLPIRISEIAQNDDYILCEAKVLVDEKIVATDDIPRFCFTSGDQTVSFTSEFHDYIQLYPTEYVPEMYCYVQIPKHLFLAKVYMISLMLENSKSKRFKLIGEISIK